MCCLCSSSRCLSFCCGPVASSSGIPASGRGPALLVLSGLRGSSKLGSRGSRPAGACAWKQAAVQHAVSSSPVGHEPGSSVSPSSLASRVAPTLHELDRNPGLVARCCDWPAAQFPLSFDGSGGMPGGSKRRGSKSWSAWPTESKQVASEQARENSSHCTRQQSSLALLLRPCRASATFCPAHECRRCAEGARGSSCGSWGEGGHATLHNRRGEGARSWLNGGRGEGVRV